MLVHRNVQCWFVCWQRRNDDDVSSGAVEERGGEDICHEDPEEASHRRHETTGTHPLWETHHDRGALRLHRQVGTMIVIIILNRADEHCVLWDLLFKLWPHIVFIWSLTLHDLLINNENMRYGIKYDNKDELRRDFVVEVPHVFLSFWWSVCVCVQVVPDI